MLAPALVTFTKGNVPASDQVTGRARSGVVQLARLPVVDAIPVVIFIYLSLLRKLTASFGRLHI